VRSDGGYFLLNFSRLSWLINVTRPLVRYFCAKHAHSTTLQALCNSSERSKIVRITHHIKQKISPIRPHSFALYDSLMSVYWQTGMEPAGVHPVPALETEGR
jgi:hypothetical protein